MTASRVDLPSALGAVLRVPSLLVEQALDALAAGGYQTWRLPKGQGRGWRTIHAPEPALKRLQVVILERLLYRAPSSPFAHGFVRGRSIVTNARVHARTAKAILTADLKDAYPSVERPRVREAFEWGCGRYIKDALPRFSKEQRGTVLDALADLTTHEGRLPQGAPTSGALLNRVCFRLDRLVAALVRRHRSQLPDLRYSRYADDLTFTAAVAIPASFAAELARVVLRSGFQLNRRKLERYTTLQRDLVVCGVRIHDGRLWLPRKAVRRLRALLHGALREHPDRISPERRAVITGSLGYLTMVTPACPTMLEPLLEAVLERHANWLGGARSTPTSRFASYADQRS